jgi:hypothetical protein
LFFLHFVGIAGRQIDPPSFAALEFTEHPAHGKWPGVCVVLPGVPIMAKVVVASLLALVLFANGAVAAPQPDQRHIDKIKKRVERCLEQGCHAVVQTYDDRRLQGIIREAGPDYFVFSLQGSSVTLHYAEVKTIKWPSALSHTAKTVLIASAITGAIFLGVVLLGGLKN